MRTWKDVSCGFESLKVVELHEIQPQLEDQGDAPIEYEVEVARGRGLTDEKMDEFKTSYNV